jgi:hypothetical protein
MLKTLGDVDDLPVTKKKDDIINAIRGNSIVIIQ